MWHFAWHQHQRCNVHLYKKFLFFTELTFAGLFGVSLVIDWGNCKIWGKHSDCMMIISGGRSADLIISDHHWCNFMYRIRTSMSRRHYRRKDEWSKWVKHLINEGHSAYLRCPLKLVIFQRSRYAVRNICCLSTRKYAKNTLALVYLKHPGNSINA